MKNDNAEMKTMTFVTNIWVMCVNTVPVVVGAGVVTGEAVVVSFVSKRWPNKIKHAIKQKRKEK